MGIVEESLVEKLAALHEVAQATMRIEELAAGRHLQMRRAFRAGATVREVQVLTGLGRDRLGTMRTHALEAIDVEDLA